MAMALGAEIARRGMRLVYGGGGLGLMAAVADAAMGAGGDVTGVIPQQLVDMEVAHGALPDLRITDSMHARKALMADLSDGFIALPGGYGTLEEFVEMLTWSQLGLQHKPCGLLDVAGFYQPFLRFLDDAVSERFIRVEHRGLVLSATEPGALLDAMTSWTPVASDKWIDGPPPSAGTAP
jgi:uncharacterized protein (TIGR00730 family)